MQKGDRVLLDTDSVTETQNEKAEFFGVSRLCELFSFYRLGSPETVITKLFDTLRDFRGGRPFADDVNMVVLKAE